MSIQGITEDDIANFLLQTPGFFERHAEVLASVQLTSPHGNRAVSLQERQMEMLREKIRGLELRLVEMIRHGQENMGIADKLHAWVRAILVTTNAGALPGVLVAELRHQFMIPQAGIRVWDAAGAFASLPFAQPVSEDLKSFATSLSLPYCGINSGFEASRWFEEPSSITSLALIPLRVAPGQPAFGMLVLGSPDPTRYSADMGTEFLARIGELASAALHRMLPVA
jgi:uncharacterized protein YigA (DUF484 family)